MKKIFLSILVTGLLMGCGSSTTPVATELPTDGYKKELDAYNRAQAQKKPSSSLWADVGSHGTIFLDYKARLIGDIIIIKITESASANNSSNTSTNRSSSSDMSVKAMLGLPSNLGISNFLGTGNDFDPTIGTSASSKFAGQGNKAKSDSISATIAARVVEILPSGNLVIEGQREIVVDQQKQTITIKGIVRQKDIDSTNVVASSAIADAQIVYSGDGVITDANRKGWLSTFLDWISPF